MATATFVHHGDSIDYTPSADITAGNVIVQNDLVGIAKRDMPANTPGAIEVAGVFDLPKATGGGTAIDAGLDVYWDAAAEEATTDPGSGSVNKKIGRSIADADDAATHVRVRLSQ